VIELTRPGWFIHADREREFAALEDVDHCPEAGNSKAPDFAGAPACPAVSRSYALANRQAGAKAHVPC